MIKNWLKILLSPLGFFNSCEDCGARNRTVDQFFIDPDVMTLCSVCMVKRIKKILEEENPLSND